MPASATVALSVAAISQPLKDLYESGKHKFKDSLSKWNNSRNIRALVTKVSAHEYVKTIWQREKKVKLSSFYYPSRITLETGVTKQVKSLRDIPNTGGVVIQGTVGQGKSIFLRYLCIQELTDQSSGRIPVFVELRKLEPTFLLKDAIYASLETLGFEISDYLFDHYAESGKIVVLLDGFDEIDDALVNGVTSQLEFWIYQYPLLQFVVTSRPGGEIQKSNCFSVIPLAPLGHDEYRLFMAKIGVKGQMLDNLVAAIDESPVEIRGLLTTPLLVTLLVLVYQSEGIVPNELPEFFKLLFTTVFSRHDRSKPAFNRKHKSGLNERKLELLFEAFCFSVLRRKYTVNLKTEQFDLAFQDALRFSGEDSSTDGFKHDVIKVACLLQEDGFYISFIHKSLLDFFPAAFIKKCTDDQAEKIYSAISSNWAAWIHVLQFLDYIDRYRFAKYFAIPQLEKILGKYGIDKTPPSKETIDRIIEDDFPSSCHFTFVKPKNSDQFIQERFGPYNRIDSYFNFSQPELINSFKYLSLDKISCPHIIENSGDIERILIYWKNLIDDNEMEAIRGRTAALIESLRLRLQEYKKLVADELKKAELMVALDVWQ